MLEIYFKSDKEVICFCEYLFCNNKHIELNWKAHEDWGNQLQFKKEILNNETIKVMAHSMVHLFIIHRLSEMVRKVIKNYFYYTNPEEIARILDLAEWIIKGEDEDSLQIRKGDPTELLYNLFQSNLKSKGTVYFDSLINFRLKAFENKIIHYVGLAIDEYKREEDHQMFIHMLREYIVKKQARLDEIHVLQGKFFSFYRSNGKQFTEKELRRTMHKEPLYIVGLDVEEFNLAPLVALAPEKIYIYGDYPSEPKTSTVVNIFQERVHIKPASEFPYYIHRNY